VTALWSWPDRSRSHSAAAAKVQVGAWRIPPLMPDSASRSRLRLLGSRLVALLGSICSLLFRVGRRFLQDKCDLRAATVSYFGFGALIPVLLLALSILTQIAGGAESPAMELRRMLAQMFPFARDWAALQAERVMRQSGVTGTIGLVVFAWIGMRVVDVLEMGLNDIWHVQETRGYLQRKLVSFGTACLAALLFTASLGITTLAGGRAFLWISPPFNAMSPYMRSLLSPLVPVTLSAALFYTCYKILPNCPIRTDAALAGALFAAALWEIAKIVFGRVLEATGGYTTMYGSLASAMASLVWIYFTSVIVFIGAEMAAVCQEDAEPESPEAKT